MAAALDKGFNVLIDAGPVDGEAGSCLGATNSLVSIVKAAEHCGAKACRNQQATAVHNQIIIDAEVVLDTPKPFQRVWQGSFGTGESFCDDQLEGLVCLVLFSVVSEFLEV